MADIVPLPRSVSAKPTDKTSAPPRRVRPVSSAARVGDTVYGAVTFLASLSIFVIIVWLVLQLTGASLQSIRHSGWSFITGFRWDEVANVYQAKPFIFGTLYSSAIALLLAVPVSIGAAIFLSELAPRWIRTPATFLIELLAAIPSVVYGLWGIFILIPFLKEFIFKPVTASALPRVPVFGTLFQGLSPGNSMLAAGVILAIMVTPFITAVTRDILRAIPKAQREGSYALGATQWESIGRVVIPYAKSGIIGAVILGLGRALGETMAVAMLIGNQTPNTPTGISFSLFETGSTMSSTIANKFNEATTGSLDQSALVEVGLVLFVVTIAVNVLARLLVFYTAKDVQGGK